MTGGTPQLSIGTLVVALGHWELVVMEYFATASDSTYVDFVEGRAHCLGCGWRGFGADTVVGTIHLDSAEFRCPSCGDHLCDKAFSGLLDAEKDWERLDERARADWREVEHLQTDGRYEPYARDLPDLPAPIVLSWDVVFDRHTGILWLRIEHDGRLVWRERARESSAMRFIEIVTVLMTKYGAALEDVVPTKASEPWLLDSSNAIDHVTKKRARLRGPR